MILVCFLARLWLAEIHSHCYLTYCLGFCMMASTKRQNLPFVVKLEISELNVQRKEITSPQHPGLTLKRKWSKTAFIVLTFAFLVTTVKSFWMSSNEPVAGFDKVWSYLSVISEAVDWSVGGKFVSADEGAVTTGELQNRDFITDVMNHNMSEGNSEYNIDPLPTWSNLMCMLVLFWRFCGIVEGCSLSCSKSWDNVKKICALPAEDSASVSRD